MDKPKPRNLLKLAITDPWITYGATTGVRTMRCTSWQKDSNTLELTYKVTCVKKVKNAKNSKGSRPAILERRFVATRAKEEIIVENPKKIGRAHV